jgi:signal transduction histidine kinase
METKMPNDSQNRQTPGKPVEDIACLSTEEKTALLEKIVAELAEKKRELEIEAALERVRTRSMAMQTSDELSDLVTTVFREFTKLDVSLTRCAITIMDTNGEAWTEWTAEIDRSAEAYRINNSGFPYHQALVKAWGERRPKWIYQLAGKEMQELTKYLITESGYSRVPEPVKEIMLNTRGIVLSHSFGNFGYIRVDSFEPIPAASLDTLYRFAKVFDLTYTRFLDLKKAEAQAKEAEIQLALERIRATAMAMHHSEELLEVVTLVREKLIEFGIETDGGVILFSFKENSRDADHWIHNPSRFSSSLRIHFPYFDHPLYAALFAAKENGVDFYSRVSAYEEKNTFWKHVFEHSEFKLFPDDAKKWIMESESFTYSIAFAKNSAICINSFSGETLSEGQIEIVKRFAKVFEQAYIRFLDLQKAEAQAREAEIQLALERVRNRSMAMHSSSELTEVVGVLYDQLRQLGFRYGGANIVLMNPDTGNTQWWMSGFGVDEIPDSYLVAYFDHPCLNEMLERWKNGEKFASIFLTGESKKQFDQAFIFESDFRRIPEQIKLQLADLESVVFSLAYMKYGALFFGHEPVTEEQAEILQRFAVVFEQTYTRFLDLQRAEEQAREAEIQLALERVRARTMAMHNSEELDEIAKLIYGQMRKLGVQLDTGIIVMLLNDETLEQTHWSVMDEYMAFQRFKMPYIDHPAMQEVYKARRQGLKFIERHYDKELKDSFLDIIYSITDYRNIPEEYKKAAYEGIGYHISFASEKHTGLLLHSTNIEKYPEPHNEILRRFAAVFEQAYVRFMDLERAEAQAREAQIEAALERVRAKALAMQSSKDLLSVANVLREQMGRLGQPELESSIVHLYRDDAPTFEAWYAYCPPNRPSAETITDVAVVSKQESAWAREVIGKYNSSDTEYTIVASGEKLAEWYKQLEKVAPATVEYDANGQLIVPACLYYHFTKFSGGALLMISNEKPSAETCELQRRAAVVFDFAYTRFLDLQKAEASAREALRRASLDRVRAEIASMRTADDLNRITPLIWKELTTLNVPFIRCGVFIMNEEKGEMKIFLSSPDGKAIAAFQLPFGAIGLIEETVEHWRQKQAYRQHWDAQTFTNWTNALIEQQAIKPDESYGTEQPPENLYLHFLPFLQGLLYVGNTAPLNDDELQLVQSLADAFSVAYSRYEDFSKLEEAKSKIEKTLNELKATQAQLIQSEKMASLGELTAGVAHEIQNPLNFVNNFSEINIDLLTDLKKEMASDNKEGAIVLADDVIQNEQKIVHHGRRADAIVKSMLQHSRQSSGTKEPVDINALIDEYLRLSYHGMRAKDKFFYAAVETHFDETLNKIDVIPQEIGRVLLNLFNNAFYAVSEKRKQGNGTCEPVVSVTTKKEGDQIIIAVRDNGTGIAANMVSKIFQPFFTTKPTGEGTGLGLSLSYDIITKGHSGELKVETKEGEGATFIIQLPFE